MRYYIPNLPARLYEAEVRGASLPGVTSEQLYSTASYKAHDLTGITWAATI